MKNVAFHNLGCKVNSYETEVMQQMLQEKGFQIVPFDKKADIYIINTCTVTNIADRKSRQMLHRARQLNPDAVVVAAGCYVQSGRDRLETDDSVDLLVGNNRKKDIAEILEEYLRERTHGDLSGKSGDGTEEVPGCEGAGDGSPGRRCADKTLGGTTIIDIARTREYEEMMLRRPAERTRAYIKIQDGCNQFCSYCAIPYSRGRVRSRRAEDILEEIRGLAAAGVREAVLTGIHLSSYGMDNGCSLIELAERIQELEGIRRIRLGSLEPRFITEETARRLAGIPKLCPHFHLSLQSGCDSTLKRMNRRYTTGEYYQSVEYLRKYFQRPAVTTDVIVGFPGETEEEFARTKAFLEKVCFYEMHIFKYSCRAGTAAAAMPGQVPEQVKARRSDELFEMERRQSREFRQAYIGNEAEVLLEEMMETEAGVYITGHTRDYVRVAVKMPGDSPGGDRAASCALAPNMTVKVSVRDFLTEDILM